MGIPDLKSVYVGNGDASNVSLRLNSNIAPWSWLVPLLLTMLIWLALYPYSAEYVPLSTLNSWIASWERTTAGVTSAVSVLINPSSV